MGLRSATFVAALLLAVPAGTTSENLNLNVDIAPTLLDIAGVATPEYMQGESFGDGLRNPDQEGGRDEIYYRYWLHMAHHFVPAHYGIRTRDHKLAFFYGLPLDATGMINASIYMVDPGPPGMRGKLHQLDFNFLLTASTKAAKELKRYWKTFDDFGKRHNEVTLTTTAEADPDGTGPAPPVDATISVEIGTCGDSNVNDDEQCDDGNTVSGDGCNSNCADDFRNKCPLL